MKIYWFKAQAPQRVLALAKFLELNVECVEIGLMAGGLRSPEYTALNPNQKAPTLVDGEQVIWESSAIMAYLCIKAGSDLWPREPAEQVEVLRWLSWNDTEWGPAVAPYYFERVVKPRFNLGAPDADVLQAALGNFKRYATILNAHLNNHLYAACGRLTIADFQMASMATHWAESEMPMRDFPHVLAWIERLQQIPAWRDPWPG